MKAAFFPIIFLLSFSYGAMANNCHKNAIQGLLQEHYPQKNVTVSFQDFKAAEASFKKLENKPDYVLHLRGEFSYAQSGPVPQVKLESGLHTQEAVEFLKKMRPDIATDITLQTLPNGVQVASLPQAAFSSHRLRNLSTRSKTVNGREIIYSDKTIFPKQWSEEEIVRAIEDVKVNKRSFKRIDGGATIITGNYKNVKIRVVIRNGEVRTAFPLAR